MSFLLGWRAFAPTPAGDFGKKHAVIALEPESPENPKSPSPSSTNSIGHASRKAPFRHYNKNVPLIETPGLSTLRTGGTLSVMVNPGSAVTVQVSRVALPLQSWTGGTA